jgi:hypothetical protein
MFVPFTIFHVGQSGQLASSGGFSENATRGRRSEEAHTSIACRWVVLRRAREGSPINFDSSVDLSEQDGK